MKEATVNIDGLEVGVAVAHSLGNARKILDQIKEGNSKYHFIEIMACPGGCIGGGGQPIPTDLDIRMKRIEAIYPVSYTHLDVYKRQALSKQVNYAPFIYLKF